MKPMPPIVRLSPWTSSASSLNWRTAVVIPGPRRFRDARGGTGRPDAVMCCLSALEHFDGLAQAAIQRIVFEITMLGTKGLNIDDPPPRYELRSLPDKFSGLQLVSLAMSVRKFTAPVAQFMALIGRGIRRRAKKLFEKKRGK